MRTGETGRRGAVGVDRRDAVGWTGLNDVDRRQVLRDHADDHADDHAGGQPLAEDLVTGLAMAGQT